MKAAFSLAAERAVRTNVGRLAAVDATAHPNASGKHNVSGFPTLKHFEFGVVRHEYSGKRTADDLYAFVAKYAKQAGSKDEL